MLRFLRRWFVRYFVLVGLAAHVVPVAGVLYLMKVYQLTFPLLVEKGLDRAGLDQPWLVALVRPAPMYRDHVLDGRLRPDRPRIFLAVDGPDGARRPPGEVLRARLAMDESLGLRGQPLPCKSDSALKLALCWLGTGEKAAGRAALARLKAHPAIIPANRLSSSAFDGAWAFAAAYDLLHDHPGLTEGDRAFIEARLKRTLGEILAALDSDDPSLWHRRAALAADAWIVAAVLTPDGGEADRLIARAQRHFLETMRALRLSEAWPSGYNYWVNSRGFWIAVAGLAFLNALEGSAEADEVRETLRRIGLWHIYQTRPDGRAAELADEGSRLDLREETARIVDLIAQATRDPVVASYSGYLDKPGRGGYFRAYRWMVPLTFDPTVRPSAPVRHRSLAGFEGVLPLAEWFGKGGLDLAIVRSGWGADDTFITFRAGKILTHHAHYDAGHFTLFKGAPLAVTSGAYNGNIFAEHRKNYLARTVAKNSILVLRPGESVQPNRFFWGENVADGGQRVILPTGSAIKSLDDWRANLDAGLHLDTAHIEAFENADASHAYIAADMTRAYNTPDFDAGGSGGKVTEVRRKLLYLRGEDLLVIQDDVTATDPSYVKKWLLHTMSRPEVEGARVLKGTAADGILESPAATAVVESGGSSLVIHRLYPTDAVMRLVGGPDYQFYVETDGDDSDLDGRNMLGGFRKRSWYDIGAWRIEIQPGAPRARDRFLVVLAPSIGAPRRTPVAALEGLSGKALGLVTKRSVVVIADAGAKGPLRFTATGTPERVFVAGLPKGARVRIESAAGRTAEADAPNGIATLAFALDDGERVAIRWAAPR